MNKMRYGLELLSEFEGRNETVIFPEKQLYFGVLISRLSFRTAASKGILAAILRK